MTELDYSYELFDFTKVIGSEPKSQSFDTDKGKVSYKDLYLSYNYGTPEAPIIDSCMIELPMVTSYGGVVLKTEEKPPKDPKDPPYIKKNYSMMFSFNAQEQEHTDCLNKLDELFKGSCYALAQFKGKVGMYSFNPEAPGDIYKNPVYWKIDELSGERIAGTNPSLWVKFFDTKKKRTLFTDLNGEPIPWELLMNVEVKLVPLLQAEKIYIGSKPSLQLKLLSAIVIDVVPMNTKTRQVKTLDRLKQKYSGLADQVSSQLAQLRMDRQDALDHGNHRPTIATLPNDNDNTHGSMHSINQNGNYGGSSDLNDFLGGAPTMQQTSVQTQPVQTQQAPQTVTQVPQVQQPQTVQTQQSQPTQSHQPVQLNVQQPPQQVTLQTGAPQQNRPVLQIH